jgi:hypothetical protein
LDDPEGQRQNQLCHLASQDSEIQSFSLPLFAFCVRVVIGGRCLKLIANCGHRSTVVALARVFQLTNRTRLILSCPYFWFWSDLSTFDIAHIRCSFFALIVEVDVARIGCTLHRWLVGSLFGRCCYQACLHSPYGLRQCPRNRRCRACCQLWLWSSQLQWCLNLRLHLAVRLSQCAVLAR